MSVWMWSVWTGCISTGTCRSCRSAVRWLVHDPSPGFSDSVSGDHGEDRHLVPTVGEIVRRPEQIPMVRFKKDDRKIDVMRSLPGAQAATGRPGVAAIGVAQEYQNVFASTQRASSNGVPWFSFTKADRRVTCFYFYLWDARLRTRVHQDLHLISLSGQGVGQRARVGQTTSPPRPGSGSPSCPTGSPPVQTRRACRRSVIGWAREPSKSSSTAG